MTEEFPKLIELKNKICQYKKILDDGNAWTFVNINEIGYINLFCACWLKKL